MRVVVENVTKTYARGKISVEVLRGIDCEIPSSSMTFFVGPSGSGKSTLLSLIGALEDPTTGQIRIDGQVISQLSNTRRNELRRSELGFVFQSFNLIKNLSALENVLVPFLPVGCPAAIRRQGRQLLEQIGLSERIHHRPATLSGGEQQRVAIARAILKNPKLVLADEPTGELDSQTGRIVFDMLRQLNEQNGATIITVTHDERYIRPGDRVLTIEDGRIVSERTHVGESVTHRA